MEKKREPGEIKWFRCDNFLGTATLAQHGFVHSDTRNNLSLCGKVQVGNDDNTAMEFEKIEPEMLSYINACKICLKIYLKSTNDL